MTYYAGRETGKPSGMLITQADIDKMTGEDLRKDCFEKEGRFHCVLKSKGNKISLGIFDSARECNAVWDRSKARRHIQSRQPGVKGYTTHAAPGCTTYYKVNICILGKNTYVGLTHDEDEARKLYLDKFDEIKQKALDAVK